MFRRRATTDEAPLLADAASLLLLLDSREADALLGMMVGARVGLVGQ